jgi:hypothetical protein
VEWGSFFVIDLLDDNIDVPASMAKLQNMLQEASDQAGGDPEHSSFKIMIGFFAQHAINPPDGLMDRNNHIFDSRKWVVQNKQSAKSES